MPFRNLSTIDLSTREKMTAIYDAVCQELGIGGADPRTGQLAAAIVLSVSEGVLESGALKQRALEAIQQP